MDSKILCVGLLAAYCLWVVEASPSGLYTYGKREQNEQDETYEKGYPADDDYRSEVNQRKAAAASSVARNYANKAKALGAQSRLWSQLAKGRSYYFKQYDALAKDASRMEREYAQQSSSDASRVGQHLSKEKEWQSKAREAETQSKDEDVRAQQLYTQMQERRKASEIAYSQASMAEAQGNGFEYKSERMKEWSTEMRRRAEALLNDAKNHYNRAKENQERANAERVKAHQQAADSQRHYSAAKAYQQDALKTRIAARMNVMKYIQNALLAERTRNYAREEETKSEMEEKFANNLAKMAEQNGLIVKILTSEYSLYAARAKRDQIRSFSYSQSSREVRGDLTQEAGAAIKLATVKEDTGDRANDYHLGTYDADDALYSMPSEDRNAMTLEDHGLN